MIPQMTHRNKKDDWNDLFLAKGIKIACLRMEERVALLGGEEK